MYMIIYNGCGINTGKPVDEVKVQFVFPSIQMKNSNGYPL